VTTRTEVSPQHFLRLLADERRWRLVSELARSDRRVGELTALAGEPQNLVSYHLRELREAGMVTSRRSSFDGRDVYYRVDLDRCRELLCAAGAALHPALTLAAAEQRRRQEGPRPHVLFLCTGNSARSQMAEALLDELSGHTIRASSAGSHPKALHPSAVRVMAERGIDISGRAVKSIDRFVRTRFDHVITLCDRVREVCPDLAGRPEYAHWSMPDPAAEDTGYPAFERTARELETRIGHLIPRLSTEGGNAHAR
jgi:ArsR family transcriptional regulator, arsenate/arsenite/antimonite-responsive transcriptional repressor / arsenate reductase (thioredoxin)